MQSVRPDSTPSPIISTTNKPIAPLHIPEVLSQVLHLLSQVDLRFGASLVCKQWYCISLPLIEWTTYWTDVLAPEEFDTTLSQLTGKTTRLVCLSKSSQIRYFMTIKPAQVKERWATLHKALGQLHDENKLLLQHVVVSGPVDLHAYLSPMLPYFRGITSLRLERVSFNEISLGAFFFYCPQLQTFGQSLPLWSLTIKDVAITHASLLSVVVRSPELRELHAERLVSLRASSNPPYRDEYLVNRNHILAALADHCPKLDSIHLSVRKISWGTTYLTMPPEDWHQELARLPQLRSYSFQGLEATLTTFPLLYDLQNHLTSLEIVGPKLLKTREIQNRASDELWTFVSEALHTYLCKSTHLLHLKAGTIRYFADYFNVNQQVDYDGRIKQTGCKDCQPGSNRKIKFQLDDTDRGMSAVWACRNLQTLDIRLIEKDRKGEYHESELKSRMMFGYLTLVCPRIQKVSIKRQIIHFNLEGGLCLVSRWKELRKFRLSAKEYIYGAESCKEYPITMTVDSGWAWLRRSSYWEAYFSEAGDMLGQTGKNLALKGRKIDKDFMWAWLRRSSYWEGHFSEAGNMLGQTGKNLALKGRKIDKHFMFPTFPVTGHNYSYLSSRKCPKRQGEDLQAAFGMVGSIRDVADVYLERATLLLQMTGSWTGSQDVCLPSLEKIEVHQSLLDRNNKNTYDIKSKLANVRPEVLVVETQ